MQPREGCLELTEWLGPGILPGRREGVENEDYEVCSSLCPQESSRWPVIGLLAEKAAGALARWLLSTMARVLPVGAAEMEQQPFPGPASHPEDARQP